MTFLSVPKPVKPAYAILGIPEDASLEEIRRAWRRVARQFHPDLHGGSETVEFMRAKAAYELLINPERRALYDTYGLDMSDASIAHDAMKTLDGLFVHILEQATSPEVDFVAQAKNHLRNRRREIQSKLQSEDKNVDRLKGIKDNLLAYWKGNIARRDVLLFVIEEKIAAAQQQASQWKAQSIVIDATIELLKTISYDLPKYAWDGLPLYERANFFVTNIVSGTSTGSI